MPQSLTQNDHPVNRLALRRLLDLREPVNEAFPFVVQLLHWGLESGKLTVDPTYADRLSDCVDALLSRPRAVTRLILDDVEGGPSDDVAFLATLPTLDLAEHLLNFLHRRLVEMDSGYRKGPDRPD